MTSFVNMASLFGHGNPLTTVVGQLVEKATDGSQASENWGLFMEICDKINETDDGPKDGIKAIKKRLSQNVGKNHTAVMYTLTCLETCVKNCGRRFHLHLATKDFLGDLIKIMGPKYDPPQIVQEKVLSLIQTWADAFRGIPDLKEIDKVYQDLKAKGIEFPMTDHDTMAPIHTPARTASEMESMHRVASTRSGSVKSTVPPQQQPAIQHKPGSVNPSLEQLGKLRGELDLVQGNVRVMGEMLTELNPSSIDQSDLELLQELNRTNRQMQQRLVDLLDQVAYEEVTNELLQVNDDINNVFLRYERFERYRTGQSTQTEQTTENPPEPVPQDSHLPPSYEQVQASNDPAVGNLINLEEDPKPVNTSIGLSDVQYKMPDLGINSDSEPANGPEGGFDMFAQSRKSFDQNSQALGMGTHNNQQEDQLPGDIAVNSHTQPEEPNFSVDNVITMNERTRKLQDKETDYDEMANWLDTNEKKKQEASSSADFDKFLANRASVAERLPSISAATGQQSRNSSRPRQLQKEEEERPLFAL